MAKILIVEDEVHIMRVMTLWIGRHGHEVLEANNGAVALEILKDHAVDLIISDMNMPKMDGLALLRAVRTERSLNTPFMLMTARCDQEDLRNKMEPFGVQLYAKPFVPSRLVANIERLIGAHKSEEVAH